MALLRAIFNGELCLLVFPLGIRFVSPSERDSWARSEAMSKVSVP